MKLINVFGKWINPEKIVRLSHIACDPLSHTEIFFECTGGEDTTLISDHGADEVAAEINKQL